MAATDADFLGQGVRFPVAFSGGGLGREGGDEKIAQSIRIILSTAPGERVMRPDFGCGIHDLVFESMSEQMLGRVAGEVTRALKRWEPRIDVASVDVRADRQAPSRLLLRIEYTVRATNSRYNLVYPFYLG